MINIKLFELVINELYKKIEELEKLNKEYDDENMFLRNELSEYEKNYSNEYEFVDKDTL